MASAGATADLALRPGQPGRQPLLRSHEQRLLLVKPCTRGADVRYGEDLMALAHGEDVEHLTIRFEEAEDGWIAARILEFPGAISQGRSHDEARANVIDALDDLLNPERGLQDPFAWLRAQVEVLASRIQDAAGRIEDRLRGGRGVGVR
jgi:predicted RNase H-like HicB family nuclease